MAQDPSPDARLLHPARLLEARLRRRRTRHRRFAGQLPQVHRKAVAAKTKAFWDGCVGEARARKCAHLTNPEAQAKSHEAQRTPEFRARRVAWAKAAWAGLTPEERKEKARKLREVRSRKRAERGLPPIQPKPPKVKVKRRSPQFRQMMSEKIKAYWAKYHAEHPQPPKPVKPPEAADRPALTDSERHAQRSAAHRKAVTAVPKDGGEPLRFDSASPALTIFTPKTTRFCYNSCWHLRNEVNDGRMERKRNGGRFDPS